MNSRGNWVRHINVLNLFMLIAAIGFYLYFLAPLLRTSLSVELTFPKAISLDTQFSDDKEIKASISDYALIGEHNLFHPDRLIPVEKTQKAEGKAIVPVPRPELVLHGTMIFDGLKIAYVEDKKTPLATTGQGTRPLVLKEGDPIGGFILKQITENMIILSNGEEQMALYLDELKDRKGEITGSTKALLPGIPAQPSVVPRQPLSQPVQRTPATQSVPSAISSPPSRSVSQPPAMGAPSEQPILPVMPSFPSAPLAPAPSPRS
jgi:hypothetical protein